MKNILTVLAILVLANTASAVDIKFEIPSEHRPSKIVGLVVSKAGVLEKTGLELAQSTDQRVQAVIPVGWTEGSKDSLVTTMYMTADGDIKFSPMKSLGTQEREDKSSKKPICSPPAPRANDQKLISNIGALQSLVDVRKVKRDITRLEISNKLKGDFLKKLQDLEVGFGLSAGAPLTAETPPAELNIRLFRILAVLRAYKGSN